MVGIGLPSTSPTLVTQTTYDADSNRSTLLDPDGNTTTLSYDALNRVTGYSGGVSAPYTYDANGNRASMADSTGTTTYTFDEVDRLLSVTSPGPNTVGYRYDLDGNRRKVIYPDNTVVNYTFDQASRLQSLTDWANRTTSYAYFADGLVQTQTNFNDTSTQFSYDNARRLTQVWNQAGANTISQHTYTLDSVGNRTQANEVLPTIGPPGAGTAQLTTFNYDKLYRLTSATNSQGTNTYTYDPVGNRLTQTGSGAATYGYDRADRLSPDFGYVVDANGNLRSDNHNSYSYDSLNRLASTSTVIGTGTYSYDGDGNRVRKAMSDRIGTFTVNYVYDVGGGLPVVLQEVRTGSDTVGPVNVTRKYVWGATGVAYIADSSGGVSVVHTDGLGSARAVTSASTSITQVYGYDEFGVPNPADQEVKQVLQYTGEQQDEESGFVFLRARTYEPPLGRFLQRDGIRGSIASPTSLNQFIYVANRPTILIDPSGQSMQGTKLGGSGTAYLVQSWIEQYILRPLAAPAYSDAPEGQPGDLASLVSQAQATGTGGALQTLDTASDIIAVVGIIVPGGGEIDAAANGPRIAGILTGFTRHGLNQIINRGIKPYEILDALSNPVRVVQRADGTIQYVGRWADLRLNQLGRLVTAIRFKPPWAP